MYSGTHILQAGGSLLASMEPFSRGKLRSVWSGIPLLSSSDLQREETRSCSVPAFLGAEPGSQDASTKIPSLVIKRWICKHTLVLNMQLVPAALPPGAYTCTQTICSYGGGGVGGGMHVCLFPPAPLFTSTPFPFCLSNLNISFSVFSQMPDVWPCSLRKPPLLLFYQE